MKRYWQIYIHLVWGTKARSHILRGPVEMSVHKAIREEARAMELVPVCVNSAWNHTHVLLSWNPTLSMDGVVERLKDAADASISANERVPLQVRELKPRWQEGYAGFSVSPGSVERIKQYIRKQKELHRTDDTIPRYEMWCAL